MDKLDHRAEFAVRELLEFVGEDTIREGLKQTPSRVRRSLKEMCSGYDMDPSSIFSSFDGNDYDQMILLKNIEFISLCEHHLLPFYGKAHIAYVPSDTHRVVGISKLARLLDIYAKRLQIQERICQQVTQALEYNIAPSGTACIIEACHLCMIARGVRKQNSIMITSSLTGCFKEDQASRSELFSLIKGA